jgi:hypothetical protein
MRVSGETSRPPGAVRLPASRWPALTPPVTGRRSPSRPSAAAVVRAPLSVEESLAQQVETVASCVLEWEGFVNDGQPVPCTKENAIKYMTAAPWIREQFEELMNDHELFSKSSSGS